MTRPLGSRIGLIASFLLVSFMAYKWVAAAAYPTSGSASSMKGVFLVTTSHDSARNTPLIDPVVVALGDKEFLRGTVSGEVNAIVNETAFSGRVCFVALDEVVSIQRIDDN